MTDTELTQDQQVKLAELFTKHIIDGMSFKELTQIAFDCIIENLPYDQNELFSEIKRTYDEELLNDLIAEVKND